MKKLILKILKFKLDWIAHKPFWNEVFPILIVTVLMGALSFAVGLLLVAPIRPNLNAKIFGFCTIWGAITVGTVGFGIWGCVEGSKLARKVLKWWERRDNLPWENDWLDEREQ